MEPKEVDINFPRGDTFPYGFHIKDKAGNPINMEIGDGEIYFTVKKNQNTSQVIFQKKFSSGDIQRDSDHDGYYFLIIEANDTNELKYGKYGYDITIKVGTYVSTQVIGTIELTDEYTHKSNE